MVQFLAVLIQATEMSGLELAVFFNGCFEASRLADWIQNQLQVRIKVNNVSSVFMVQYIILFLLSLVISLLEQLCRVYRSSNILQPKELRHQRYGGHHLYV